MREPEPVREGGSARAGHPARTDARTRRLAEELAEEGLALDPADPVDALVLAEVAAALRPAVHERRVPSSGSIVAASHEPTAWAAPTGLTVGRRPLVDLDLPSARRFADGLASWLCLTPDGGVELVVFDRPAGSERDLVVLAEAAGATLVQRHPSGTVRAVSADVGVLRWDGLAWHHEPPIRSWIDAVRACGAHGDGEVLGRLLDFAVHDLGARGIGALLVYRPEDAPMPGAEQRLPVPPPLEITRPVDLAPLRHALALVDGAAVFDAGGVLRHLGVRLVPSPLAEDGVEGLKGMRHTAGIRYSHDDPRATVIVVSEDGPVTVLRNGAAIGRSDPGC